MPFHLNFSFMNCFKFRFVILLVILTSGFPIFPSLKFWCKNLGEVTSAKNNNIELKY